MLVVCVPAHMSVGSMSLQLRFANKVLIPRFMRVSAIDKHFSQNLHTSCAQQWFENKHKSIFIH